MKKAIAGVLGLCAFLYAAPIEGRVSEAAGERIVALLPGAKAGQSAIVLYRYEGGEAISRECVVTDADRGELICRPFEQFDQDSVPKVILPVKPGDRVIAGPLSATALIIAPSAGRYVRVQDRHKNYRFIHPDLFAAQLTKADNPVPKTEAFKTFCDAWMVGTLIFALKDGDWIVDCQSFTALAFHADTPVTEEAAKPFYHRLDPIERGFFSWGTPKTIADFDAHYQSLIQKEFHAQR